MLSLGRDLHWRQQVIAELPAGRLLDLGGGTGAANPLFRGREVVALDPEPAMLALNRERWLAVGFGERLPFASGRFDAVFSAFVFRNLTSVSATLVEIARVLRPGGAAGILDIGRPLPPLRRAIHRAGTAVLLPLLGLTVAAPREYTYLHRSLDRLPPPETLFADGPLRLRSVSRMGLFGFVYGAILTKARFKTGSFASAQGSRSLRE